MTQPTEDHDADQGSHRTFTLRFTPAEWRTVLEDASFLAESDNSYRSPRKLMGVAVEIVPDHEFG
jgi:hypothetical protein